MADQFILVDTDILIDVSRGISQAIETLEELQEDHILSISVVTQMELISKNQKDYTFIEDLELRKYIAE